MRYRKNMKTMLSDTNTAVATAAGQGNTLINEKQAMSLKGTSEITETLLSVIKKKIK